MLSVREEAYHLRARAVDALERGDFRLRARLHVDESREVAALQVRRPEFLGLENRAYAFHEFFGLRRVVADEEVGRDVGDVRIDVDGEVAFLQKKQYRNVVRLEPLDVRREDVKARLFQKIWELCLYAALAKELFDFAVVEVHCLMSGNDFFFHGSLLL